MLNVSVNQFYIWLFFIISEQSVADNFTRLWYSAGYYVKVNIEVLPIHTTIKNIFK